MRTVRLLSRHIGSLGLALALALVPLAPVLCGVTCASHAVAAIAQGEHHSCHPPSEDTASVRPVPHSCGHQNDDPVALQELIHLVSAPAIAPAASMTALVAMELQWHAPRTSHTDQRPPGAYALTTQLRV